MATVLVYLYFLPRQSWSKSVKHQTNKPKVAALSLYVTSAVAFRNWNTFATGTNIHFHVAVCAYTLPTPEKNPKKPMDAL